MDLHQMAKLSRQAAWVLAATDANARNAALLAMADALEKHKTAIFAANEQDVEDAKRDALAAPLLGRLRFGEEKLRQVTEGLHALAKLPDPIGQTTLCREITPGLKLYRVTCPIGVIGVIFESRPDALVQIASLALKSGNAVLLKGGREALRTNRALCDALREAAEASGLPADFAQLMESREDVAAMLKEDALIDLIIPRGSNAFVRYIMDNSRIPVLGHADGICHVYVDKAADLNMAVDIIENAKTSRPSVCNAEEVCLVHKDVAAGFLPLLKARLVDARAAAGLVPVDLRLDERAAAIIPGTPAGEQDFDTEFLNYILAIAVVDDVDAAIAHIARHSTHHSEAIITADDTAADRFTTCVDSAAVYVNASTRFTDGGEFGLGCEMGISTQKLHARGPMGLAELCSYKYIIHGSGQTRGGSAAKLQNPCS